MYKYNKNLVCPMDSHYLFAKHVPLPWVTNILLNKLL